MMTVRAPFFSTLFTDWTSFGPGARVNGTLPTPGGPVLVNYEGDGAGADLNGASTNFSRPETFTPPLVTSDAVVTYGSPGTHHKLTFASRGLDQQAAYSATYVVMGFLIVVGMLASVKSNPK